MYQRRAEMAVPGTQLQDLKKQLSIAMHIRPLVLLLTGLVSATGPAAAQTFPPVPTEKVARYEALRTPRPPIIDGRLDERVWQHAPRSPRFTDLISGKPTIHNTQAAVLWDDKYLYVAFWVEEPFVTAKFQERDQPIWQDNDVEFFLAGPHAYYEFEINAHGTLYEGLFVWQESYKRHGFDREPTLDRSRPSVKSQPFHGVGLKNHPRGPRWAFLKWDFPAARTAVWIDGTLNDNSDRDRGWTVELAFPWDGMRPVMRGSDRSLPPKSGDVWRMDFSRFNQYKEAAPAEDSGGWAWSHHGVWDSHVPEVFPFVTFSTRAVADRPAAAATEETP